MMAPGGGMPGIPGAVPRFGKLSVKLLKGLELQSLGALQTADPYVRLTIGTQSFDTKVINSWHYDAKTPFSSPHDIISVGS
jgi:hypothetical protein